MRNLNRPLYLRKQRSDAIVRVCLLFLRLQQIIRQSKGHKGQQNILGLPSVEPQLLVSKPLFYKLYSFLHAVHICTGLEGYAQSKNGKVDSFLIHKNLLYAVMLLNVAQHGVNAFERLGTQLLFIFKRFAQPVVFIFQGGLFLPQNGRLGAYALVFRPKAVKPDQKSRNLRLKLFQKFHAS